MSITTALKARQEALRDREAGFTLIELLVVVIIIGILAAIAIPIYVSVTNNAKNSALQSDLGNAKTATVNYYTQNNNATLTPAAGTPITTQLKNFGYTPSAYDTAANAPKYFTGSSPQTFCITGTSNANVQYSVTSNGPIVAGACPADASTW